MPSTKWCQHICGSAHDDALEFQMITAPRARLSAALLNGAMDRSLDAQALEQSLSSGDANSPGYDMAVRAVRHAQRFESALIWFACRLQPRMVHLT